MPRRCTVCDHPERHGIDEALVIFKRREQRVVEEGKQRAVEEAWRTSERRREARRRAEDHTGAGFGDVCRHLEAVYKRRSAEWGPQGNDLEDREANRLKGDAA